MDNEAVFKYTTLNMFLRTADLLVEFVHTEIQETDTVYK